jgi:signal transduction histidine kinase/ActR/RegA family two-component response regulator
MDTSEELREALLNLEEARKREAAQRQMAEALLAGLRVLVLSKNPNELFAQLFEVMKKPLEFDAAFVLIESDDGSLSPMTASDPVFMDTAWKPGSMLKRVMEDRPAALFETQLVEEWTQQPEHIRRLARSALHFSIHTAQKKAIFVCTHSDRAHFSRDHLLFARRFSVLATQAMQKLESEERLADLERRLEAEAELAALNQRLAESEKKLARARNMEAVGLLAGGVAHDLNNILSGIVSYPELLLMEDDLLPEHRNAIQIIREAGLRATAVVEDLLTIARGVASPRENMSLNRIVREYLLSPEHQGLLQRGSRFEVDTDLEKDLLNIMGSHIHVTKALMNLVTNAVEAVQHKKSGRILIRTENRYIDRPLKGYSDVRVGEYVVLEVQDNGDGISEQDIERIFEPFYTRKVMGRSGTGLGLTIVWNVIQDHNGYVDVTTDDQGTCFRLYFPVTRDTMEDVAPSHKTLDYMGEGETVLVIDDLEDQRRVALAMLDKLGYSAHAVSGGEEALEYLKEHSVDILLLDMIMDPGINGLETYRRIIDIHPGQKAVIASGYSLSEDVVAAQGIGAGPFIKKPYTLGKLGFAIKEELRKG